jgi:hypothetical protein
MRRRRTAEPTSPCRLAVGGPAAALSPLDRRLPPFDGSIIRHLHVTPHKLPHNYFCVSPCSTMQHVGTYP